jgi:flagellar hook-associated protein 3 FlgL
MLRSLDSTSEMLLAQLDRIDTDMQRVQKEITSGRKVNNPSDGPDQVGEILILRAAIERNTQINTNLERARSEAESADSALQNAVTVLERAAGLAVSAGGDLQPERRQVIAEEVRGLEEELVALSQTTYGNRYLFSGDLETEPSYALDAASPTGVARLASPSATRQVEHPTGVPFSVSRTAQDVFDARDQDDNPAADNAFAAIHGLLTALEANDAEGVKAAEKSLRLAGTHVNGELSFYGAVENRISTAVDDAGELDVRLRTALSGREDADLTESIMELQQLQLSQSASLQMRSTVRSRSLFDYLK